MNMFNKTLSTLLLLFIIYILFDIGQAPLIEGYNLFFPYIDTEFGKEYTPDKFDQIKLYDSKEHVLLTLGSPLYTFKDTVNNVQISKFTYTNDGYFKQSNKIIYSVGDFAWYRSNITFNNKDQVIYIDKGWSFD